MKKQTTKLKESAELYKAIGLSRAQFFRFKKADGFPKPNASKKYDVAAVRRWIVENGKLVGSGRSEPFTGVSDEVSFGELKRRGLLLDNEMKRLDLDERHGELVKFSEAKELLMKCFAPIARRLKDLPARMAMKCNPSDPSLAKDALRDEINNILTLVQSQCEKIKSKK